MENMLQPANALPESFMKFQLLLNNIPYQKHFETFSVDVKRWAIEERKWKSSLETPLT